MGATLIRCEGRRIDLLRAIARWRDRRILRALGVANSWYVGPMRWLRGSDRRYAAARRHIAELEGEFWTLFLGMADVPAWPGSRGDSALRDMATRPHDRLCLFHAESIDYDRRSGYLDCRECWDREVYYRRRGRTAEGEAERLATGT